MLTWLVHLVDLAIITGLCHLFRLVTRQALPDKARIIVEEFISTADFCGCCFEMAFICETYGTLPFAVCLFLMCVWWCTVWGDAAVNPNKHLEDFVRGDVGIIDMFFRIASEFMAGVLIFKGVYILWAIGLSHDHYEKSEEDECLADLQVSPMHGALIEGLLTFIDRLNALTSEHIQILQSRFLVSALSTILVVSALNYSGGYFNPALALSHKYGCVGHTTAEFFFVYFIGSIVGSMLALLVHLTLGFGALARQETAVKEKEE